jgi:hypothetical protein
MRDGRRMFVILMYADDIRGSNQMVLLLLSLSAIRFAMTSMRMRVAGLALH